MKCMFCGNEMQEGGIITQGVSALWVPLEEYNKRGIRKMIYTGGKSLGKIDVVLGQVKLDNAYYCPNCNKVIGYFDVKQ